MLHFCWPTAFSSWENFQLLFDVSDVEDEASTEQFLRNEEKQEIISMMHKILQPMMLRRIKADVLKDLPPKREYVLYAPLTKEQTALYRVIADKKQDAREYLQKTLVAQLSAEKKDSASEEPRPSLELATRRNRKRKSSPCSDSTGTRSAKSSRLSTPLTSADGQIPRFRASLADADSDEDLLDDDEFEAKLLKEHEEKFGEKLASALNLVPAGDKKKAADTCTLLAPVPCRGRELTWF